MPIIIDSHTDIDKDDYRVEVGNRVHDEFWHAFAAWEDAPDYQKPEASARLNQSVRQLYDFVVRGQAPRNVAAPKARAAGRL
jgi:hypothetical protein